jgi:hypothetical protein
MPDERGTAFLRLVKAVSLGIPLATALQRDGDPPSLSNPNTNKKSAAQEQLLRGTLVINHTY